MDGQTDDSSKVTESEGETKALEIEADTVMTNGSTYGVKTELGFMPPTPGFTHLGFQSWLCYFLWDLRAVIQPRWASVASFIK